MITLAFLPLKAAIAYLTAAVTVDTRGRIDKAIRNHDLDIEGDTLDYAIGRTIVVCPACGSMKSAETLEQQLQTEHACRCGAQWYELPTHDVRRR